MFGPDDFEMQIQQEEIPGIHTEPFIPPAQDEQYGDLIVKHGQNMGEDYENRADAEFLPVNEMFGILYVPLNEIGNQFLQLCIVAKVLYIYGRRCSECLRNHEVT